MKLWLKIVIGFVVLIVLAAAGGFWYFSTRDSREPSFVAFNENCASCHGDNLAGTETGPALIGSDLTHGDSVDQMMAVIAKGNHGPGMEDWDVKLSPELTKGLALYISERRQNFPAIGDSYQMVPEGGRDISSIHHDFRLEKVTTLVSRPYSIDTLPGGSILVAEKTRGLSIVDGGGTQSPPIEGTPEVHETLFSAAGTWVNLGSMLDVELHPDYENNGWIYLSYTDRCMWSCGWPIPATMVRVVRGRITDGKWVDQELIWSVHEDHYTPVPDGVASGRLAFDGRGYLYIAIGGKNTYDKLHQLDTPFGKIHRVHDDGSIPEDNPFYIAENERPESSTIHTLWSYGHRTGQGLDGHPTNGEIWNTEMGPRGGDEVNKILPGENYGWPLYTNGLDYNGEEISIGKDLGLDYAIEDTILPTIDLTPAPAISNFTFHNGDAFSNWENDLLVGTLKEAALYRFRIENGVMTEQEKLLTQFGRIRDVEMGTDGLVYIAIEHNDNGSLWRLVPR